MSMFQPPGRPIASVSANARPLPLGMKHGLVRLGLDRAEPLHAAHVLRAVHDATSLGRFGRPVPIMLSRVTRSASFSSLQPSVPAGRIGSTM